jgi:hypothetical protein
MPPWLEALFAALTFAFGTPVWITMLVVRHRERMRRLEYARTGSPGLATEVAALREGLAALREELAHLRETTTHFDMSFDAALERLERRVAEVNPSTTADADATATTAPPSEYRAGPAGPMAEHGPNAGMRRTGAGYGAASERVPLRRS